ncbi:DH domain-containing protein [Plasmodiophora brassicae]
MQRPGESGSPAPLDKCRESALEVISSEKSYVHALKTTVRSFHRRIRAHNEVPRKRSILTNDEIDSIFLNIVEIYAIQKQFYERLKEMRLHGSEYLIANIHQVLLDLSPLLTAYSSYAKYQQNANNNLQKLRRKNGELQDLLTLTEMAEGMTLEGLLIQPVQRIPRYILLLKEMIRHTKADEVRANLQTALAAMETAASDMNLTIRHHETHLELIRAEEMFQMRLALNKPGRVLVKEGYLRKAASATDSKQSMFASTLERRNLFLLFTDMLLCSSDNTLGPCRLRWASPLHLLQVSQETVGGALSFRLTSSFRDLTLCADAESDTREWITKLQQHIPEFANDPNQEKLSTEAELEFTLKRDPGKIQALSVMNQYRQSVASEDTHRVANNEYTLSRQTSTLGSPRSDANSSDTIPMASMTVGDHALLRIPSPVPSDDSSSSSIDSGGDLQMLPPRNDLIEAAALPSAPSSTTNHMEGYLSKRGDGIKTWKRRYFVADTGQSVKLLRYYKDESSYRNGEEALGFIDLDMCAVVLDLEKQWGEFAFEIYPSTSDRCYMLVAEGDESRATWFTFLKQFQSKDRFIEGYLLKKGNQLTGWKSRYFVCLQSIKEVLYFKNQRDSYGPTMFQKALGSIHLKGCTIRESSAANKTAYNKGTSVFEIHSSANADDKVKEWMPSSVQSKPSKTYVMAAGDDQTMARWVLLLTIVVGSSVQENEQRLPLQTVNDLDD